MVQKGRKIRQEQSDFFKDLLSSNPDVQNNSNLDFKEIWDKDEVKRVLAEFPDYVNTYNATLFHELQYVYGTHNALKLAPLKKLASFEIKRGCFEEISNQYSLMDWLLYTSTATGKKTPICCKPMSRRRTGGQKWAKCFSVGRRRNAGNFWSS